MLLISQDYSSNKSFIVSIITSATTAKSEGHSDPPKSCLKEMSKYHLPPNFTLTADLVDVCELRCSLLKADL